MVLLLSLVSCTLSNETFLIASFWIERTATGYEVDSTFDTLSLSRELQERARERIEAEQKDPTIYRIDVISSFGKRESHFTTVDYYPPDTDVGETLRDREIPVGSNAFLGPINLFVSDQTKRIEIYVADQLVHTVNSFDGEMSVLDFAVSESEANVNGEIVPGHEVFWAVDGAGAEVLWVTIEYQDSPDFWTPLVLGTTKLEGSMYFQQENIQSTLDSLNLRTSVTDGFSTKTEVIEDVIDLQKELELELLGFYDQHRVGLHVNIELWFIDPETGAGCDGRGCTFGENEGNYEFTWFSDAQNICPTDIYDGVLVYVFKSEGTHRIGATVQHVDKPELSGEVSVDAEVGPGDLGRPDPNPECSDIIIYSDDQ